MRKLNQRKIRWIIREMEKGERSVYRIAKLQNVTPRWVREIYRRYKEIGEYPYPNKPGRKPSLISDEERRIVLEIRRQHPVCAVTLEKILDREGIHIPHNRIHRILKEEGLSRNEPKKQKRRKWIRYERRHSNSLWHGDWFEYRGKHIVVFEDDASRLITGFGVFSRATARNAVYVLDNAVDFYGAPKQVMTDHGVQFTSIPREGCPDPKPNVFQKRLKEYGIKHVKARVKHPQSNGKVEKASDTIMKLYKHFKSWDRTVAYYNFERPHMSLLLNLSGKVIGDDKLKSLGGT
ncbi:MAG: IS481 family transposase [Aquificota bacterium]|nr:MAG: IS481 family transposase [Aquificota bacterium]RLF52898.1 MAG: IS481 family transposase [Thermoplasmata archaeon]